MIDVVVIGAGPAGLSASLQLERYGLGTILFEKDRPGGLLFDANLVENYPGFAEGISGTLLAKRITRHARLIGVEIVLDEVIGLREVSDSIEVRTDRGVHNARAVIIATGTRPRIPSLPGVRENIDRIDFGMGSFEDIEGPLQVAVIGGGDAAYDYGLNLAGKGAICTIICRSEPKALKILRERAAENDSIRVLNGVEIERITRDDTGFNLEYEQGKEIHADRLLMAVGRDPCDDMVSDPLPPGVFKIGDMVNGPRRQAAIAAGDGIRCAFDVMEFLRDRYDTRR